MESCGEEDISNPEDNLGDNPGDNVPPPPINEIHGDSTIIEPDNIDDDDKLIDIEEIVENTISKFESRIDKAKDYLETTHLSVYPWSSNEVVKAMLNVIRNWKPEMENDEVPTTSIPPVTINAVDSSIGKKKHTFKK